MPASIPNIFILYAEYLNSSTRFKIYKLKTKFIPSHVKVIPLLYHQKYEYNYLNKEENGRIHQA
jgi:hypothetical protein